MTFAPDVSLYYFAGDFADVLRRERLGIPHTYGTHHEVARLLHELVGDGYAARVTSFVTPTATRTHPVPGIELVTLGAPDWSASSLLRAAAEQDRAPMIVAGFPDPTLLRTLRLGPARCFSVLASSFNDRSLLAYARRRRLVGLLNDPKFEWVSNHGWASTKQLARFGVNPEKLLPWDVPHHLDAEDSAPKSLRDGDQEFKVLYVGAITPDKGVPELIRAAALLRGRVKFRVALVGAGDLDGMRSLANAHGVSDLVDFSGPVDNPVARQRMRDADLVVVPSRRSYPEGFPLAMFEAIASRTPIVCSDHPMFVEHLVDGRSAATFRSGDPRALAAAITRALTNAELYHALSRAAPDTLARLLGSTDYREMILHWVRDERPSAWIGGRTLAALSGTA